MAIPLFYNLRNLMIRKTTTVMTGLGITFSVAVLVASLALVNGLRTVFASTGHPLRLLVLRKGGTTELGSLIPEESLAVLGSDQSAEVEESYRRVLEHGRLKEFSAGARCFSPVESGDPECVGLPESLGKTTACHVLQHLSRLGKSRNRRR